MADRMRVEGQKQIAQGLGRTIKDLDGLERPIEEVAQRILDQAKRDVPKRTGRLAGSGRLTRKGASVTFGRARVPYANAINWGVSARVGLRGPHNIARTLFLYNAKDKIAPVAPVPFGKFVQISLNKIRGA